MTFLLRCVFILVVFLIRSPAESFEKKLVELSQEFLEKNFSVFKLQEDAVLMQLNYKTKSLEKRWSLLGKVSRQRDNLERYPRSVDFPSHQKHVYGIDVTRNFSFGGSLTFSNELSKDMFPDYKYYGPIQGLSYTQDLGANFLGRKFYSELEQARLNVEYMDAFKEEEIQEELYLFILKYMEIRLAKTMFFLEKEALKRADKRLDFVREKVKDGLREQVDLYQSQSAFLSRQELLNNVYAEVITALKAVSEKLGRGIKEEEVLPFSFEKEKSVVSAVGNLKNNLSLKTLNFKVKQEETALRTSQYDLWPQIKFQVGYKSNDYDSLPTKAFYRAQIVSGNRHNFFETLLSLEMPLGFQKEKIEIQKTQALLNISKKHYDFYEKRLKKRAEGLLHRIWESKTKLVSVRERLRLAQKILSEYNSLYRLGRVNLDQVIRAEEDLIDTQKNLVNDLFSKRDLNLLLASLYGSLRAYLKI